MIFIVFTSGFLEESYAYSDEEYYDQYYMYSGYKEMKSQKEGFTNEKNRNDNTV